jgi:nucleoside-diphosphate kinase
MKKLALVSLSLLSFFSLRAEETFMMIKPDQVKEKHVGSILSKIEDAGFKISALKMTKLSNEKAADFYGALKDKPFYKDLVDYMTKGPIVAIVLSKDNAVDEGRKIIGATDPKKALDGSIRQLFGKNIQENAIHGSDSIENAKREIAFFFTKDEIYN